MAKAPKIKQVRFTQSLPLGRAAEMFNTLRSEQMQIDGVPFSMVFDADARFLQVSIKKGDSTYVNLIPLSSISVILLDEQN